MSVREVGLCKERDISPAHHWHGSCITANALAVFLCKQEAVGAFPKGLVIGKEWFFAIESSPMQHAIVSKV